jgi:uncharacterized membrane protein
MSTNDNAGRCRGLLHDQLNALAPANTKARIVIIVALAILNPGQWYIFSLKCFPLTLFRVYPDFNTNRLTERVKNSVELEDGKVSQSNIQLCRFVKLPDLRLIMDPTTILDQHGRVLVWHLPDILIGRLVCFPFTTCLCALLTYKHVADRDLRSH